MVFNPEGSSLQAELVDEKVQKDMKMVDLSVIKKGLNFHGTDQRNLEKEKMEIKNEEARMERENAMMGKSAKPKKDDESEAGKPKSTTESKADVEEEREGKLKPIQV